MLPRAFKILILFIIATVILTWPLILNLDSLIINKQDGLLITWFLNWNIAHPGNFNANIFYPYANTLAYSETMMAQSLLVAPLVLLFKEPLIAYNISLLLGFILTGFSMYLFLRYLTGDIKLAVLIAAIFNFSGIHLEYMTHLQLFNIWPVILATMFLLQKRHTLFILFFVIASLTTALFFYFLLLIIVVYIIFNFKELGNLRDLGRLIGYITFGVVLTLPFLLPYYFISRQFNYIRPITDVIHFSMAPSDLMGQFFPGWGFLLISILTFRLLRRKLYKDAINGIATIKIFLTIAIISFILAFGPVLHLVKDTVHIGPIPGIPLPYLAVYYIVPGFSGFRTPSRFMLLAFFAICTCIGIILKGKISNKLLILTMFLLFLGIKFPINYHRVPSVKDFPPEQIWLKDNYQGAPIVQFPIFGWWDKDQVELETVREYYSTIHWHPMFNGYSGFSPQEWEDKVLWLQKEFPSEATVSYLKEKKVKLVLTPKSWEIKESGLKLIREFSNTNIYEIYD